MDIRKTSCVIHWTETFPVHGAFQLLKNWGLCHAAPQFKDICTPPKFLETQLHCIHAWIIERLDRKLADAISSNIVEKCDVTLSRAIQPLSTSCASYVSSHISLSLSSNIHIGHVLK